MPEPQTAHPNDAAPVAAYADVCNVQRGAEGVALLFGRRTAAGPGAQDVALQCRVVLGTAGAARLQDMMTALLQGAEPPG